MNMIRKDKVVPRRWQVQCYFDREHQKTAYFSTKEEAARYALTQVLVNNYSFMMGEV